MREQREPWLKLPAKEVGTSDKPRVNPRFRTHVVTAPRPVAPASPPSSVRPESRPTGPKEPEIGIPGRGASSAPTPAAIERAAAAARLARPIVVRPEPARIRPAAVAETPRPPLKPVETRAPAAPSIGLDDVPLVSSLDWATKVGQAAKMVDVVVVLYTAAYLGTEMFEFAFRTVVNEVLPHLGRPYTVYRFSLDDEPEFVTEMATSLGLPPDNPVTVAGFAWSGPGRRMFLLGDKALPSPAVFQRSLRRSLAGEPAQLPRTNADRRLPVARLERPRPQRDAVRSWGGRVIAILAWCLFGTAALGAAVVGLAPQWTSSILYPTALPEKSAPADNPPPASSAQTGVVAPPVIPDSDTGAVGAEGSSAQGKPAKPKHIQRRHTPRLSLNPTYWGLPSLPTEGRNR